MFAKSAKRYHREWVWKITDEEGREYLHPYDAKGKRVYIAFESSSLGDTLAWIPYVEEFRKLHECEVTCSTHWNDLFKDVYPDIEFIPAGQVVYNIYAMYRVGWFYENDGQIPHFGHHSRDFRKYSLQGTITDILGLPDTEIRPKIKNIPAKEIDGKKVVVIAPHATAWAKYWHNPEGWAKVVEFLQLQGYEVWNISKEPMTDEWHNSKLPSDALKNVIDLSGNYPIEERISQIKCASLFIGLGSGLSWLAWACETPVVLISGFSRPESEFQDCVRIFNQNVCNGCFNDYRLDAGNWQWCPKYEKTAQQFECSKSITPEMVIDGIRTLL
jgi:autotransporter strand-loop-strand O-heptosyltransferase